MSSRPVPTECPKCGKPVDPPRVSRGAEFRANILIPATCSDAPRCDWEHCFPYICAHCGSHRLVDVVSEAHAPGGLTLIRLGQVCAECERSVTI